jgi:hypothetical protein
VKRRVGGWCEITANLRVSQLGQEFRLVEYSPDSSDVSTEAEESPLLEAVTKKRLVEIITDLEH